MAEDKPSLHIDTDWKRQAQEEKKRLAEEEAKKKSAEAVASPATAASVGVGPAAPGAASAAGRGRGARGEPLPAASFIGLVQSLVTQVLYYLGDLAARGSEPAVNLDMAKHQIDLLGIMEEKTRGNLSEEEKTMLDSALYETRMRYVSVASQYT
jgi:hypothetical protein